MGQNWRVSSFPTSLHCPTHPSPWRTFKFLELIRRQVIHAKLPWTPRPPHLWTPRRAALPLTVRRPTFSSTTSRLGLSYFCFCLVTSCLLLQTFCRPNTALSSTFYQKIRISLLALRAVGACSIFSCSCLFCRQLLQLDGSGCSPDSQFLSYSSQSFKICSKPSFGWENSEQPLNWLRMATDASNAIIWRS